MFVRPLHRELMLVSISPFSPSPYGTHSRPKYFCSFENFKVKQIRFISLLSNFAHWAKIPSFVSPSLTFSIILPLPLIYSLSSGRLPQQSSLEAFGEGNTFVWFPFSIFYFWFMHMIQFVMLGHTFYICRRYHTFYSKQ